MKLPLSWLDEYIEISDIPPHELAERLTRSGLQVESIETVGQEPLSDFFVVGEVLTCELIEGTHLHKTTVTDGKEMLQVVCGAPNCRVGIKSILAKIGAVVPDGGFKIKKGKLRGVESFGMLCSSSELKLPGGNHDGIIDLPQDTPVGKLARDVFGGDKPETVFDIEVTWNRPDALSVIGIAREFSAVLGRPCKLPPVDFVESDVDVNDEVKVVVEDPVRCPRYTARVVTSVQNVPSPEFMAKRLEACGVRSLGLLVDVTNYVMLECGQPMHAFDYRTLAGRTIVVRDARDGEQMKTLDGVMRRFDPSMLLICDAEKASAVAGIMGGEQSEIEQDTGHVLIESALFEPTSTKDTATTLDLGSESSYRYIRGVDKDLADWASRRAVHLLQKYGNAAVARGVVDVDNRERLSGETGGYAFNATVELDFTRARRLIGVDIPADRMVAILESLGLKTVSRSDQGAVFAIPSWRYDLLLEADLVEEIGRLYGLDNIPDTMPSAPSVSGLSDAPFRARNRLREVCLALGFTEAMHYSFLSQGELDQFDPRNRDKRLALPDPVSAEYGVLRDSLLPQLYQSLGRNAAHQLETARLFEIGRVFGRDEKGHPCETERLSIGFFGPVGRDALDCRRPVAAEEALLWIKGAIARLASRMHVGKMDFRPLAGHPAFENGAALELVVNGRPAGVCGVISAALRHPFRLTTQMAVAEIAVEPLLQRFDAVGKVVAAPAFPMIRRDFAFVAGPETTHDAVVKCIRKAAPKELVAIDLFDIYSSKELGKGRRSFAYKLAFRSPDRTLTDDEVSQAFVKILDALRVQLKVEVRGGEAS